MQVEIFKLQKNGSDIKATAQMLFDGFGHYYKDSSVDKYAIRLSNQIENNEKLVFTMVAKLEKELIATACTYVKWGGEECSGLSPWLGGLYVHDQYRKQGVAKKLFEAIRNNLRELDIKKMYLHTPNQELLYNKWGWKTIKVVSINGRSEKIMEYAIFIN